MSIRRSRVRVRRALVLAALVVAVPLLPPGAAADERASRSEDALAHYVNALRARAGLPGMRVDRRLSAVARQRSVEMLSANTLWHAPNLVQQVGIAHWQRIGENVGIGGSARDVHVRLVASAPHRANLLGHYDVIGIGAVRDQWNRVWVTQVFVDRPGRKRR